MGHHPTVTRKLSGVFVRFMRRFILGMSDGLIPPVFSKVNPLSGTPKQT
jgi:hypothetical protein